MVRDEEIRVKKWGVGFVNSPVKKIMLPRFWLSQRLI